MSPVEKKQTENTGIQRFFLNILSALLRMRKQECVRVLTYREAVRRILCCKPSFGNPSRGVLIRESYRKGFRLVFLYLDEKGLPIKDKDLGDARHTLIAESLDDELVECFGDGDLLVFD